ncbi:hypothetical protein AXE80_02650 [Wenyingzhuangia fucanilytica]|uniref:Prenyltransferase n=1 Tax=Wenyingzhuangia fucanilytica TaxID=1790137 RepID=A0A1B1Y3B6_9FLAO|nr:hypothetical protein [Wenyingzhuangia fucanilytica]ANW95250.1 hypothetical protein AXE80_02650 [Wenyingzhuangia fucanilytica]
MKFIKALFQFYVYSNLHVSIAVACLVMSVGFLFDVAVSREALLLMCATFVSYHLIRFLNRHKYGKKHLLDVFSNEYKVLIYLMIAVAMIVGLYELIQLKLIQFLHLLPFVVLTLLYAYSFIGKNGVRHSIRFVPGIKIFVIAFVWAGTVVFFPVASSVVFDVNHFLYFLSLLLFVVVLTLPFDIRDLSFDEKSIRTLPMLLGLKGVKFLGVVLLVLSIGLHWFVFASRGLFAFLICAVILAFLLFYAKEKQPKYYASFWVEGIPILYYILLIYA